MKWQGGRFLVLLRIGGRRVTRRFHLFSSHVDQQNDEWSRMGSKCFRVAAKNGGVI